MDCRARQDSRRSFDGLQKPANLEIFFFWSGTGIVCMINIVVVGLTQTKLANLANTKVKRELLVVFINFSPLPVIER